jgi:hypothetical protein
MAKRKYSMTKRNKKVQPVPLKLNYLMSAEQGVGFIDLMKDASRAARKFFRQGKLVAIANVRITMPSASTPTAGNAVYVSAMQNNWCTSNAWHKAFAVWDKQQREALEDSQSQSAMAGFRDFKVFIDYQHEIVGNLEPVNLGPFSQAGPFPTAVVTAPALQSGEWDYSQIVVPDPATGVASEYSLHMHGPTTPSSKGIVAGYQSSRSYPQSPDPVSPAIAASWMNEMFDVGGDNTDVVDNATNRNDNLPYDQDQYPGGPSNYRYPENKAWCFNRSTTGVNTFNLGGFVAPCGILRIDQLYSNGSPTDLIIEVELLPGHDRGLLLSDMQDM